jgi:hypothetical protein
VTFSKAIQNNIMYINESNSGLYGFNFDVSSGGEINFDENRDPDELSLSNNGATVNPSVQTPGINYNGD